jgi:hypothetical protein
MNEKKDLLKIIEGISFSDLNPHNFHLKNDYINNILITAFSVLPVIAKEDLLDVRVIEAFVSSSFIKSSTDKYLRKHFNGRALRITWRGFKVADAIQVALSLFEEIAHVEIVIDNVEDWIMINRNCDRSVIIEYNGTEERVLKR